jgi:hypothetical protein
MFLNLLQLSAKKWAGLLSRIVVGNIFEIVVRFPRVAAQIDIVVYLFGDSFRHAARPDLWDLCKPLGRWRVLEGKHPIVRAFFDLYFFGKRKIRCLIALAVGGSARHNF